MNKSNKIGNPSDTPFVLRMLKLKNKNRLVPGHLNRIFWSENLTELNF